MTATLLAVAVLLGSWIYVLFFYDPGLLIDELADRTFPTAAEQVCAAAKAEFDQRRSAADERLLSPLLPTDFVAPTELPWPEYVTTARGFGWTLPTTQDYGERLA